MIALSLAGLALLLITATALATTGALTEPSGTAACISENFGFSCTQGHGLDGPYSVAVSPDGKTLYAASYYSSSIARIKRHPSTGAITQGPSTGACVSETGADGCADGHGLTGAEGVALSPDGKSVYVASYDGNAIARFNRNTTTGALTQPPGTGGCISEDETGGTCTDGHGLDSPVAVDVSPDGKSVYVASTYGLGVARFNRNKTTGAITQPAGTAGCISDDGTSGACANGHALLYPNDLVVTPDGKNVYVGTTDGVARLNRNKTTGAITQPAGTPGCITENGNAGTCTNGHALDGAFNVAVSPDGEDVYALSDSNNAVAHLDRNPSTGGLTQAPAPAGCVSSGGYGPCAVGHALGGGGITVSPDGKSVYVTSEGNSAVARLNRRAAAGGISQPAGSAGCISDDGSFGCADGTGLAAAHDVAVSPDGKSVYVSSLASNDVARFNRAP